MLKDQLQKIRKKHNKTQQEIADILGITQSAYAYYETGRNEPDIETLKKLADYYETSIDYLVGRYGKQ